MLSNSVAVISVVFIVLANIAAAASPMINLNNARTSRTNTALFRRKVQRQEQLCPVEYQLCWCDYVNTADKSTSGSSSSSHNSIPASASHLSSAKAFFPAYFSSSMLSFSIMIDCQLSISRLNRTTDFNRKVMTKIPKIQTSSANPTLHSNKFKYLSHITHLDLSRTAISEVGTDAFFGLTGLQTIVITHCRNLVKIGMFAFRNLPNLRVLIINNNPGLIELEPYSFGSLQNMDYLSLGWNRLNVIDGYIFSVSSRIKIIDFIGNPIKRIKSHAFHGLRNVTELYLSLEDRKTPIEHIEGDSFISTAFVDQIHLDGIPAKMLGVNAFRGLSFCKYLHLSNTHLEEIDVNAFFRANNIQKLEMRNGRIRRVNRDAFRGVFNIDLIDMRGNYLTKLDQATFEHLVSSPAAGTLYKNDSSSIMLIDVRQTNTKKLLFEQNPIQCDCNLMWILNNKLYASSIGLPEICAGPKGYDCLRLAELNKDLLQCSNRTDPALQEAKSPCDDIVFDIDEKSSGIHSISVPKGQKKQGVESASNEYENYNDETNSKEPNTNVDDPNTSYPYDDDVLVISSTSSAHGSTTRGVNLFDLATRASSSSRRAETNNSLSLNSIRNSGHSTSSSSNIFSKLICCCCCYLFWSLTNHHHHYF